MDSESIEDYYHFVDGQLVPRNRKEIILDKAALITPQQAVADALHILQNAINNDSPKRIYDARTDNVYGMRQTCGKHRKLL